MRSRRFCSLLTNFKPSSYLKSNFLRASKSSCSSLRSLFRRFSSSLILGKTFIPMENCQVHTRRARMLSKLVGHGAVSEQSTSANISKYPHTAKSIMQNSSETTRAGQSPGSVGGSNQTRTGVNGFADRYLTTRT